MFYQSARFSRSLYPKAPHYAIARLSLAPHQDTWISGIFLWQWTSPSHLVGLHAASTRAAERLVLLNTKIATSNSDIVMILTYLCTYLLTQWGRVLLEKLTGLKLVKKFPAFYGTQKFITAFTTAR
jgi:hypothetical protein